MMMIIDATSFIRASMKALATIKRIDTISINFLDIRSHYFTTQVTRNASYARLYIISHFAYFDVDVDSVSVPLGQKKTSHVCFHMCACSLFAVPCYVFHLKCMLSS